MKNDRRAKGDAQRWSQGLRRTNCVLDLRLIGVALFLALTQTARAQTDSIELILKTADREVKMLTNSEPMLFTAAESSKRTGGHLWDEVVVRTERGDFRRLTAVDGFPLTPTKSDQEYARVHQSLASMLGDSGPSKPSDDREVFLTFVQMMP
jgi:hypothetical protein